MNIDQKYLDILHTWDSLTKMQQLYQLNFQKIYLQLKEKREGGQLSKTVHIPPLGTQTQSNWHPDTPSSLYGSQMCRTPSKCIYGINHVVVAEKHNVGQPGNLV